GHIDLGDPSGGEIEVGEVTGVPFPAREVLLGDGDEEFVEIDTEDGMPFAQEQTAGPTRPAAGVEDAGLARGHRIDEARLSPDVVAGGGAFAPHLRVVGRMLGIGPADLIPLVIEAHMLILGRERSGVHANTSATTSATARTGSLGSGEVRTMISRPPASATGWSSTSSPPKDIMIGLARVSPSPVPARARATAVSVTICVSFAVIPSAEVARRIARPKSSSAGGRIQSASASCPARGFADPAGTTIPKSSSATAFQL